jgi:sulfatase maturation enzyme AslB (radical SAM superfamily)
MFPFTTEGCPPKESTLVCKVCKIAPMCLGTCQARIYFVYTDNPEMSRAAIHFGEHGHLVAMGMYRDSTKMI